MNQITALITKPVPLYAAIIGVVGGVAGAYFIIERKLGKEFDQRLSDELVGLRVYYGAEKEYSSPEAAVEALYADKDPDQLEIVVEDLGYNRESETDLREVVKNVFTDAADDMGDFDAEAEMAAREAGLPYVLLHDEFFESDLDGISLEFYEGDNVLADDKGQPITDVDNVIGEDSLLKFGHGSRDPNVVYVHNPELDTNFEIVRNNGRFDEIVLGLKHSEPTFRRMRDRDL
jgi:hypothetical protein